MQNQNPKNKNSLKAKSYKLKANEGFTLIESMVAIAIFTIGVSAAIFVIQQSLSVGARVKNKIIAGYLAQEGIEVARNIRDRNWMAGKICNVADAATCFTGFWIDGINNTTDGANPQIQTGCVEYSSSALDTACVSQDLSFNGNYYVLNAGASQFERSITTEFIPLDTAPNPDEPEKLKVISTVTCGINCSVSLEEYLYNWK